MSLKSRFFQQFANPHGVMGRLAGTIMAKKSDNQDRGRWTIELLDLDPADRVLELGYGPGLVAGWLAEATPDGEVIGVDRSSTMQHQATKRNSALVKAGQLTFLTGDAENLPAEIGHFDAICGMNVWQFWSDPVATFRGIADHLSDDGTVAITYLRPPTGVMDADGAEQAIATQMQEAGIAKVRVERTTVGDAEAICVLGQSRIS